MSWIKKIKKGFFCLQANYSHCYVEFEPEDLNRRMIYIIGTNDQPWLVYFLCPCGCGKSIKLNLLRDATPCWYLGHVKSNKISIFPSIRNINGCKSHFIIRNSKVFWFYERLHYLFLLSI